MKKVVCIALLLCMVCSVASAEYDLFNFNVYAGVFGCELLEEGTGTKTSAGIINYNAMDCIVSFDEEGKTIYVYGKSENFLPYCMAAVMAFEPQTSTFIENCGKVLGSYLMARNNGEQMNQTTSGYIIDFSPNDDKMIFMIMK